jgi:hypothetical protein
MPGAVVPCTVQQKCVKICKIAAFNFLELKYLNLFIAMGIAVKTLKVTIIIVAFNAENCEFLMPNQQYCETPG